MGIQPAVVSDSAVSTGSSSSLCPPIFVGGQRRSGTTLMRTILNRHPDIASLPECHFFQHIDFRSFFKDLRHSYREVFDTLGVRKPEMDRAVAGFVDALFTPRREAAGARRWLEKSPENIRRIGYLFRLFPDAQFIHMIRDPRDTLASMKQQAATEKPYWAKFTAEVTGPEWVRCIESGLPWRDRPWSYLEVRYEHLVTDPEATSRRVLDFLGERWTPDLLRPTSDAGRKENEYKSVFSSSIGRWRHDLTSEEIACIQSAAGETMTQLGYELL